MPASNAPFNAKKVFKRPLREKPKVVEVVEQSTVVEPELAIPIGDEVTHAVFGKGTQRSMKSPQVALVEFGGSLGSVSFDSLTKLVAEDTVVETTEPEKEDDEDTSGR